MFRPEKPLPFPEFVALMALMISFVAMSTDIMLPALGIIGRDLGVADPNDAQLIVSALFMGFAVGQMFAGPISDTIGRKPTVFIGYGFFLVGCLLAVFAPDLKTMLIGRVLQGLGAAPSRIITIAIVRDSFEGRRMARVMSISMSVFVLVPAIAPTIGQGIISVASWHATFLFLIAVAIGCFLWLGMRQPETLKPEHRRDFSLTNIVLGLREVIRIPATLGYTLSAGCVFGCFLGYLNSSQQVFQTTYGLGHLFPIFFGVAALAIGAAAITNSKLVMRFGMRVLTRRALMALTALGALFAIPAAFVWAGHPPLWLFMAWLLPTFFCAGMLFGNINALAMEPLGHMAGLGSAFIGSVTTFMGLPLGWTVGHLYDGTVLPMVLGFAVLGGMSLALMLWTEHRVGAEV